MRRTSSETQILAIKTQLSLESAHLSKNYGCITGSVYPATPPSPPYFKVSSLLGSSHAVIHRDFQGTILSFLKYLPRHF